MASTDAMLLWQLFMAGFCPLKSGTFDFGDSQNPLYFNLRESQAGLHFGKHLDVVLGELDHLLQG